MSIYNDNFTTPESREPYFIKVHRCIIPCWYNSTGMPIALIQKEIEIVVADINNQKKFYKYVVYDHISCVCRNVTQINKLHKNLVSNEGKRFNEWTEERTKRLQVVGLNVAATWKNLTTCRQDVFALLVSSC